MKNYLYVFYNNLSKRYGDVICFPSDSFMLHKVQPSIPKDDLETIEVCRVGSIDILTGEVTSELPVRIAWRITEEKLPVNNQDKNN